MRKLVIKPEVISVKAIEIRQRDRSFYTLKISAKTLLEIAYFNSRELDREDGIQRPFNLSRSKQIANYIDEEEDSVIANNIIINIDNQYCSFTDGILDIKKNRNIAFVIDGQHRLRAFNHARQDYDLLVSVFLGLSPAEIAEIFVRINYYQKPVNKSLVYDLLGISPDLFPAFYEAHEITNALNDSMSSPWFGLIKMLGIGKGVITQATFISGMDKYNILSKVLCNYTKAEKTLILSNYFEAIKITLKGKWANPDFVVCKSIGYFAFMKVFEKVFTKTYAETRGFKVQGICKTIQNLGQVSFSPKKGYGGMSGVNKLSEMIEKKLGI